MPDPRTTGTTVFESSSVVVVIAIAASWSAQAGLQCSPARKGAAYTGSDGPLHGFGAREINAQDARIERVRAA
jgi:hypothetical protein